MADEKIAVLHADTEIRLNGFERDVKRLESLRAKARSDLRAKLEQDASKRISEFEKKVSEARRQDE